MKFIKIRNSFINLPTSLRERTPKSKPGRPGCKLDTKLTIWKIIVVSGNLKKDTDMIIAKILKIREGFNLKVGEGKEILG
jgi:hypothetical protein